MEENFISILESSLKKNWDLDALTDYKGATLQYKDLARKIEKIHILFEESGIAAGDKVALCGRNSAHWAVAFLATLTYGAVAVPILHEFRPDTIHHLINHSEARLFFVDSTIGAEITPEEMPVLEGIFEITDFDPIIVRSDRLLQARQRLNELYGRKFPAHFTKEDVHYRKNMPDELAIISYTSGTTSQSKGVMIPYRSLYSNMLFAMEALDLQPGDTVVSMLPMAHAYGMAFEFLYEICIGMHVYYLTRLPSPKIIFEAFAEIKPTIIISVPLIIEKIIKKSILPKIETPTMKVLLHLPLVSDKICTTIREQMMKAFGGQMKTLIIGGAALNHKVELFLKKIELPYTVGYGMTECGPIICYEDWRLFAPGSCGKAVPRMEVRIDSPNPTEEVGEILCRGMNVMLGYYKNEEATKQTLDSEGWLHTGDLGIMDEEGNVFIKGRSKNMLLSGNGQNIYPEEIEDQLNAAPLVGESVVVQRDNKLVALVYPDMDEVNASRIDTEALQNQMEENRKHLNLSLPTHAQLNKIEIVEEEFEKTPKKSIKRFLYS